MADNSDVWTGNGRDDEPRERSPRRDTRDERERSPARRERTRSPARNGGGGGSNAHNGPPNPDEQNQGDNLHVSGLSRNMTEKQLTELFNQYAKVYKAEIMYDPHTRESRGFGFVKMDTPEDARIAIEKFNGTVHDGKSMTVAHARRGRARTPTPGRYHGVKLDIGGPRGGYGGSHYGGDRPYQPRSYDSRYDRGPPPRSYDDRRYDDRDRRYDDRRYDDRPQRYDDRRYDDRGAPPVDRPRYDDRPPRDDRPRYDERPPRY